VRSGAQLRRLEGLGGSCLGPCCSLESGRRPWVAPVEGVLITPPAAAPPGSKAAPARPAGGAGRVPTTAVWLACLGYLNLGFGAGRLQA